MEKSVTPTDTHYWIAVYEDGTYDIEGTGVKFGNIKFDSISHFTLWPKSNTGIAICIIKPKNCILIWRKQRHVKVTGEYLGSDYMLGLDLDDGSENCKKVQNGQLDPYDLKSKYSPDGFRVWLMKDGKTITQANSFQREDIIKDDLHYIICKL